MDKDGYIDTVGYKISNFVRYLPDENDNDYIPSNLSLLLSRLGEYEERIKKLPERKIVEIVEDESNPASFKDLADYIYLNTEIRQQHRYAPVIINSIKKILDNCHDETIKDNFGQKLLEAFDAKHKELIDNHTKMSEETYNIEYTDIMVAKCFIQLHMDELNTI